MTSALSTRPSQTLETGSTQFSSDLILLENEFNQVQTSASATGISSEALRATLATLQRIGESCCALRNRMREVNFSEIDVQALMIKVYNFQRSCSHNAVTPSTPPTANQPAAVGSTRSGARVVTAAERERSVFGTVNAMLQPARERAEARAREYARIMARVEEEAASTYVNYGFARHTGVTINLHLTASLAPSISQPELSASRSAPESLRSRIAALRF